MSVVFDVFKKSLKSFWRSENETVSLIRDVFVAFMLVLIILMAMWAYTGQWFSAPMVAIESGSMMHPGEPFGRVGTIDAGDMVLLVKVNGRDDVVTYKEALNKRDRDHFFYGKYGDVIIYRKYGLTDEDQIIHRAMCWVEYVEENDTYLVEEYGLRYVDKITIPELGLNRYDPKSSGFITQGDNPFTNPTCDQVGGICSKPIRPEWITGKARGEIPWVGTINLFFDDLLTGSFWDEKKEIIVYNVPGDCVISLVLLIVALVSIPAGLDVYDWYKKKKSSVIEEP